MWRACAVSAAVLALGPSALPGVEQPRFSSELSVVIVPVTVRDKAGQLVKDLRPEDFRILEDGRPQALARFETEAGPQVLFGQVQDRESLALDLGLLLDTSESMLKELKLTQEAAVRFLEAVPRARDLVTIFFDEEIRLSRYNSENQQGLFERIHALKGGGNTALHDAIAVYLSRVQEPGGRKVLVLFTDGEDSISTVTPDEVFKLVRASGVTVYAIAFAGQYQSTTSAMRARHFLDQLAVLSGGQVFRPLKSRDLAEIYDKILEELSAQYVLGFVSDQPGGAGRFRKLKVEVRGEGLKVRHRAGYVPPLPD